MDNNITAQPCSIIAQALRNGYNALSDEYVARVECHDRKGLYDGYEVIPVGEHASEDDFAISYVTGHLCTNEGGSGYIGQDMQAIRLRKRVVLSERDVLRLAESIFVNAPFKLQSEVIKSIKSARMFVSEWNRQALSAEKE